MELSGHLYAGDCRAGVVGQRRVAHCLRLGGRDPDRLEAERSEAEVAAEARERRITEQIFDRRSKWSCLAI